jgi:hypothetical protein
MLINGIFLTDSANLYLIVVKLDGMMTHSFRLLGFLGVIALMLSTHGGSIRTHPSEQNKSNTFHYAGSILFAALYSLIVAVRVGRWLHPRRLMKHR